MDRDGSSPLLSSSYHQVPCLSHSDISFLSPTQVPITATHTRTIKCTPSVSNPSFYLSAVAPSASPGPNLPFNKYLFAEPSFSFIGPEGNLFIPGISPSKDLATVFELDSKNRLVFKTSYGDHFSATDFYNNFQLFEFFPRKFIQDRTGGSGFDLWGYINCTMVPPSGRFAGGYKELKCSATNGVSGLLQYLQWCPIYYEWFSKAGTVLGEELSLEAPDCLEMVWLVVPVCGG